MGRFAVLVGLAIAIATFIGGACAVGVGLHMIHPGLALVAGALVSMIVSVLAIVVAVSVLEEIWW